MDISKPLTITLKNLSAELAGNLVLNDVSLTTKAGCITALLGANGAGKSSLLSAMVGLLAPTAGTCEQREADGTSAKITRIGYVLQKPIMLRRSVAANMEFAMAAANISKSARPALKQSLLALMKIEHMASQPAFHMSQGERQRLAVARVLAMRPGILMLDEATNSLDQASTNLLEHHIRSLADAGMPVFWVTHHEDQARRLADHVIRLEEGRITADMPAKAFFQDSNTV